MAALFAMLASRWWTRPSGHWALTIMERCNAIAKKSGDEYVAGAQVKRQSLMTETIKSGAENAAPNSADMSGGPGFRWRSGIDRPAAETIAGLTSFATADISDALNRMFMMDAGLKQVTGPSKICGPAVTVKVFPGDNLMLHKALDLVAPGDVIVVDTSGSTRNAVLGDMIANKAHHLGVAGFIVDGLIRDIDGIRQTGMSVFARGVTGFGPLHRGPGEVNYAISCGGIVVEPGDVVAADADGCVVIRKDFADRTLENLQRREKNNTEYVQNVKSGMFSNAWVQRALDESGCESL